ncbi:HLH transcription factor-like protein [Massarina eburnea CBS 473.64]|uniref:HLH transcription factor-like protein n=1 Tax=Massarina eburnea CBS 473.64 TaxID=1395130 RepID=A0A6A6RW39_9PLEO|nr:HLH transcription factor-like protein [Massarina eburnea CBS 473.64]
MPAPTDALFTPPPSYSPQKTLSRLDLQFDSRSDDSLDADIFNMAGTGSPTPYIKEEVDDMHFNPRFMSNNGFDMNQPFGNQQFSSAHENSGGINPSDLTMSGNLNMNSQFGGPASYVQGGAGIADDELADSLGGNYDQHQNFDGFQQESSFFPTTNSHAGNHINQVYSHTPDDVPIQSPFVHPNGFDFNQYQSTPQRMGFPAGMQSGAMRRPGMPAPMSRNGSEHRSPMSPKTPAMSALHLGTPDSGNFASQPIMTNMHRHKPSMSSQWDGTPGSAHSQTWIESPGGHSPHNATLHHQQISEVIHSGKHASLPTKVDIVQTQDAKKRRRRESHNLVERRRRDNINERIHDLSRLVPQHRLEDEKIRKHINNNGPLSPTISATGMSPPQATSLLAGGTGRRAAGNITQGLPIEDKDKGPNKGDILNGAVSWTRDLMWYLDKAIQQNEELTTRLRQLSGEEWPTEQTEDERRMKTELHDAIEKNGFGNFKYSRGPGSGLRVPKHTNLAGEALHQISPQSLSPDMQSTGSGPTGTSNQQQYWSNHTLKEEDEYNTMEMG